MNHKITVDNLELMLLIKDSIENEQEVHLKVKGASMLPFLKDLHTTVVLKKQASFQLHDIVLFEYQQKFFLHRIVKIDHQNITCGGDGLLTYEHIQLENIIAGVISFETDGKTTFVTNKKYQRKVKRWWRFRFLRRVLLKWYRLKN